MSIRIMADVWENGPEDQGELLVLLALADHSNDQGECWPSMDRIAEKARMSKRNVRRVVRKLESEGYIDTQIGKGRGHPTRFTFKADKMSPLNKRGHLEHEKGTSATLKEDTAMSAEPSRTVNEPSERAREAQSSFLTDIEPGDLKNSSPLSQEDHQPKERRSVKRLFPETWVPSDRAREKLRGDGFSDREVDHMGATCRDWHLAKGNKFADHDRALYTWASREKPGQVIRQQPQAKTREQDFRDRELQWLLNR